MMSPNLTGGSEGASHMASSIANMCEHNAQCVIVSGQILFCKNGTQWRCHLTITQLCTIWQESDQRRCWLSNSSCDLAHQLWHVISLYIRFGYAKDVSANTS